MAIALGCLFLITLASGSLCRRAWCPGFLLRRFRRSFGLPRTGLWHCVLGIRLCPSSFSGCLHQRG